jgi:multicomponent Na+:H+ antiporter subunit C
MTADLFLAGAIGVLFAAGVYLMVSRNLIRVLLGFLLVGHGTNLLLLAAGTWGTAPILGESAGPAGEADPLPQAFVLTSIVITLAVCCFLLAMVFRGYQLTRRAELDIEPEDVLTEAEPGGAE